MDFMIPSTRPAFTTRSIVYGLLCLALMAIASSTTVAHNGIEASRLPLMGEGVLPTPAGFGPAVQGDDYEWYSMVTDVPQNLEHLCLVLGKRENLPFVTGAALMTAGLRSVDNQVWNWTKPHFDRSNRSDLNNFFVGIGDGRTHLGVAGAFALSGLVFNDQRALRTAGQTVEAVVTTGIVVQLLKHITGRQSPMVATRAGGEWRVFPNQKAYMRSQAQYYAFPSGHTAATMAVVTVIAQNYPEQTWIKPAGAALIGMVELGLVNAGMHWYSDFPVALLLGYSCGMIVSGESVVLTPNISLSPTMQVTFAPVVTFAGPALGALLWF